MKSADPTIKIFIFDECDLFEEQHRRIIGGDLDLMGKDENGNWMVDGITFHRYPGAHDRNYVVFKAPHDIRVKTKKLMKMIDYANKKHGREGEHGLQAALPG